MGAPGHALEDSRVESKACKTDGLDKDRRGKIDFSEGRHCGSSLDMGIIIHSKRHKRRFCRDTYSLSPSARKKFYPSSLAESHQLAEKASIVLLKSTVSKNSCVYYWVVEFVEELALREENAKHIFGRPIESPCIFADTAHLYPP